MTVKILFRNIHLYLGLLTGLVIAVVCLTGAILVFEKELQTMIYPERHIVSVEQTRVPLDQLVATSRQAMPDAPLRSVKLYGDPTRSVEVSMGEGKGGQTAFLNPYTGELLSLASQRTPFFLTVFSLHRWLLAGDTGKTIVGVSTLIFLFILFTGIVLWWPKNSRILKQRLTMKWTGGWKRLNHDLHIVVGLYSAIFLFIFAFTGLAWSFTWFNDGIYWITGSEKKQAKPPVSQIVEGATPAALDRVLASARNVVPASEYYTISPGKKPEDAIRVSVLPLDAQHEKASGQIYIDQFSGNVLGHESYEDRSAGDQLRSLFYAIHISSVAGLPGRIFGLLVCLAGFTFPITGTILWLNRLAKNRKQKKSRSVPGAATPETEVEESALQEVVA